jgi:hypothetical protein
MMKQQCDRIFVRDGSRSLCWRECDDWDRVTMLACLAGDPRSLEELAAAWSRYRPHQSLLELEWREEAAPPGPGEWLAIDLQAQRFAWRDPDDLAAEPGCYEPDDVNVDGRNLLAWINVPPWWQQVPAERWSFAKVQPSAGQAAQQPATGFDFRSVLYGPPLLKYIAEQALACKSRLASMGAAGSIGRGQAGDEVDDPAAARDGLTPRERAQAERFEELAKKLHARWLMTPRAELRYRTPRTYLHEHREWKDRELDQRRSQWSRQRRPPPPAPRDSSMFLYGPMGTEEVMSYFDLCRHISWSALQLVDDEPKIALAALIERLGTLRDGWLASEVVEGDGMSVQEVIDGERQLVPRVASSDPIDCDCPLCRIHTLDPEMFGPAFSMCDPYREEMEEDFVFSIYARREDWEKARDEWRSWTGSEADEGDSADEDDSADENEDGEKDAHERPDPAGLTQCDASPPGETNLGAVELADGEWAQVWQSSYSDMSHGNPRLSLLGIGGHLAEIIDELKRIDAARREIDELNQAFDELARSIRRWLTREATGDRSGGAACGEPAAGQMIQVLEALALKHPELTAKSADLQSQIHQWQRQLLPTQGGL